MALLTYVTQMSNVIVITAHGDHGAYDYFGPLSCRCGEANPEADIV